MSKKILPPSKITAPVAPTIAEGEEVDSNDGQNVKVVVRCRYVLFKFFQQLNIEVFNSLISPNSQGLLMRLKKLRVTNL